MSSSEKGIDVPALSKGRKGLLLAIFCLAQFMDTFNSSALFPSIIDTSASLDMSPNDAVWIFAAYQAPFAAFLLISGRVSDVYSAKWTFMIGAGVLGAFSLGAGFVHDKVTLFVLRGFAGVCAAMTIPSALSLIVENFPTQPEQGVALSLFAGTAAIGNMLGLLIGGAFVRWVSWRWIYFFSGIIGIPTGIAGWFLIPTPAPRPNKPSIKRLDVVGVSLAALSFLLFIYAVTAGPNTGWATAQVLVTLILGVVLIILFFFWEARTPESIAALPPKIWFYPNIGILVAAGLIPIFWWGSVFFVFAPIWQGIYKWDAFIIAVRFLPISAVGGTIAFFSSEFPKYVNPKWSILIGQCLILIGTIFFPFADRRGRYWYVNVPGFMLGSGGTMTVLTNSNVAIFMNTPPEIAGIVGAVFNSALQLGSAVGLAAISAIKTSQDKKTISSGGTPLYAGARQGWYFSIAFLALEIIALLVFYKIEPTKPTTETVRDEETGSASSMSSGRTPVGLGTDLEKRDT